jgi:peptidoglycan/LPS O-acetylase OafA/YrhL
MTTTPIFHEARSAYRADIDGMRAVAVLLVVFYHLHFHRVSGGFIGVDVFFVISGYLISSVILKDMDAGRFSIANFYERRIRRILPALFAMFLVVSLGVGWYMAPSEIVAYAWSMIAASFSWSNLLFLHQGGYFDAPPLLKPLLHTWSLAVEEQFYIFFPLLLLTVRRWFPRQIKLVIWVLTGASFGLACLWVQRDAVVAFYATPLRAWELLIGTIISQRYLPEIRGLRQRNVAAFAGIAMIVFPAFLYNDATAFPGVSALVPCAGAGLIIAAGEHGSSMVGKALAQRPVVFVGLISYSLYLWHWPVIVFQNTFHLLVDRHGSDALSKLSAFALSLILAVISWRFVETPFREGPRRPKRRALFLSAGVAAGVITAMGVVMIATGGLMFLMSPLVAQYTAALDTQKSISAWRDDCFIESLEIKDFKPSTCLRMQPGHKHYLLLGDSHAAELYPGLATVFPELDISQLTATAGCPFLRLGATETDMEGSLHRLVPKAQCRELINAAYSQYLEKNHFDVVLLGGFWFKYDLVDLQRTIAWFKQQGTEVILFGPNVVYDVPLPTLLIWSVREHHPNLISSHVLTEHQVFDRELATFARTEWNIRYISSFEDLCAVPAQAGIADVTERSEICPTVISPGNPLLFDTNHFSVPGSVRFAQAMREEKQLP